MLFFPGVILCATCIDWFHEDATWSFPLYDRLFKSQLSVTSCPRQRFVCCARLFTPINTAIHTLHYHRIRHDGTVTGIVYSWRLDRSKLLTDNLQSGAQLRLCWPLFLWFAWDAVATIRLELGCNSVLLSLVCCRVCVDMLWRRVAHLQFNNQKRQAFFPYRGSMEGLALSSYVLVPWR